MSSCFAMLGAITNSGGTSYIADAENHSIRLWDGANVSTFAGTGYPGFVDGYKTSARFNVPGKAVKDSNGNMWVADIGNNAIRKIDTAGYVTTVAGRGPQEPGFADGPGSTAKFFRPTAIVSNPADGMTYVADSHNHRIRRIDGAGNVSTYAGTGVAGLVNGAREQAQFSNPTEIAIYNGFMYVSDTTNNVIRRIDMANGQVSTYIS